MQALAASCEELRARTGNPPLDCERSLLSAGLDFRACERKGGTAQPRTQAQITKNRHTTVLLYRSVAKLSERAGVLGEDAGNEASLTRCVLPKHPRST